MYQVTVVDRTVLAEIVRRLAEAVDPDKIVRFGSRARGDHQPQSAPTHKRAIPAYLPVGGMVVSKDILWYTPDEMRYWSDGINHVIARALREGRVLYEEVS